ncbi:MAG: HD domain-containing protein [Paludibacter sp.]|nr:HD domain-containing protein [Paludibacter sp.]
MDINNFGYIQVPDFTGNFIEDVKNLLVDNNKYETFIHVESVAKMNIKISEQYNLDKAVCKTSAYLHDISTIIRPDDMLSYVRKNKLYIDEAEQRYPFLLHQRISKIIAESIFNITDPNILSAIECHTTLKANPTAYEMALFIADKLSWDQDGNPPFYDTVNNALNRSLESASLTYINYMMENKMILYPHSWFLDGKRYLDSKKNGI